MGKNESGFRRTLAVVTAGLIFAIVTAHSYSDDAAPDEWKAPPREARKKNPVPADDASIAAGKSIYTANCLACHGPTGKGDGPAAITCNPRPHNLTDPKIAGQTDGALYWKITEGKKPMPTYAKLLSDNDRWNAVNYLRVLAPKPAQGEGDKP